MLYSSAILYTLWHIPQDRLHIPVLALPILLFIVVSMCLDGSPIQPVPDRPPMLLIEWLALSFMLGLHPLEALKLPQSISGLFFLLAQLLHHRIPVLLESVFASADRSASTGSLFGLNLELSEDTFTDLGGVLSDLCVEVLD
jgi:hypothetical protein